MRRDEIAAKGRPVLVVGRRYRVQYQERGTETHAAILTYSGRERGYDGELFPMFTLSPDDKITLPGSIRLLDWEEL